LDTSIAVFSEYVNYDFFRMSAYRILGQPLSESGWPGFVDSQDARRRVDSYAVGHFSPTERAHRNCRINWGAPNYGVERITLGGRRRCRRDGIPVRKRGSYNRTYCILLFRLLSLTIVKLAERREWPKGAEFAAFRCAPCSLPFTTPRCRRSPSTPQRQES
jgi:hypothetical protein